MRHLVRIGRNEHAFNLHLLDAEILNSGHVPEMLEIITQAVQSPFGRSSVVFLCPEVQPIIMITMLDAMRALMDDRITGIRHISIKLLSADDPRLPSSYVASTDAPLVCFSIARLSCLACAMAMANVGYRDMGNDYAAWLRNERLAEDRTYEESGVHGQLTEHGKWIEERLHPAGYPWHYPLDRVGPIFHEFVRRCEQLPEATGHTAWRQTSTYAGRR